jgi:hypothetical protein
MNMLTGSAPPIFRKTIHFLELFSPAVFPHVSFELKYSHLNAKESGNAIFLSGHIAALNEILGL